MLEFCRLCQLKKPVIFAAAILLVFGLSPIAMAQTIYEDAKFLGSLDPKTLEPLPGSSLTDSQSESLTRMSSFLDAPLAKEHDLQFLRSDIDVLKNYLDTNGLLVQGSVGSEVGAIGFAGGLSDRVIQGTADFLYKRAKAEATLFYLDKLKEVFEDSLGTNPRFTLRDLFPTSYSQLVKAESLMSPRIGATLLSSFEKDLAAFPQSIDKHALPDSVKNALEYKFAFASYLGITGLLNGDSPTTVLERLRLRYPSNSTDEFHGYINIVYHLSEACRDIETPGRTWIPSDKFRLYSHRQWEMFIALLYQGDRKAFKAVGISADDLKEVARFSALVRRVAIGLEQFNLTLTALNSPHVSTNSPLDIWNNPPSTGAGLPRASVAPLRNQASYILYAEAFVTLLELSGEVLFFADGDSIKEEKFNNQAVPAARSMVAVLIAVDEGKYQRIIPNIEGVFDALKVEVHPAILRTGSVAADLVLAEDSDEVSKIIENAVMPAGSYKRKRAQKKRLFLNAYVGGGRGYEWINLENKGDSGSSFFGAWAPIGVEYTIGEFLGFHSGLFVSVLDFGTLVSHRAQSDFSTASEDLTVQKVSQSSNVSFAQIFSPGIFWVSGLGDSPFSLGLGAQMTPKMRKVTTVSTELSQPIEKDELAVRVGLFIAVDIPLVGF